MYTSRLNTLIDFCVDPPLYTLRTDQETFVVEGSNFTYTFTLTSESPIVGFNWTRNGVDTGGNGHIVTTATSTTITNVMRSDSGTYQVFSTNSVGTGTANFTLDVQCTLVNHHLTSAVVIMYCVLVYPTRPPRVECGPCSEEPQSRRCLHIRLYSGQ